MGRSQSTAVLSKVTLINIHLLSPSSVIHTCVRDGSSSNKRPTLSGFTPPTESCSLSYMDEFRFIHLNPWSMKPCSILTILFFSKTKHPNPWDFYFISYNNDINKVKVYKVYNSKKLSRYTSTYCINYIQVINVWKLNRIFIKYIKFYIDYLTIVQN